MQTEGIIEDNTENLDNNNNLIEIEIKNMNLNISNKNFLKETPRKTTFAVEELQKIFNNCK